MVLYDTRAMRTDEDAPIGQAEPGATGTFVGAADGGVPVASGEPAPKGLSPTAEIEAGIRAIDELTLMDDRYMAVVFAGSSECTAILVRALIERDVEVSSVQTHVVHRALVGKSVELDIRATDSDGNAYDIEVQRVRGRATPRRARFYSAELDRSSLKAGQGYEELPDSYVVFITDGPVFNDGAVLCFERIDPITGTVLGDGSHIIYVDATMEDDGTELASLMKDFHCADPDQMRCKMLSDRARSVKESSKEALGMRFEDLTDEQKMMLLLASERNGREEANLENLRNLMATTGWDEDRARQAMGLPSREAAGRAAIPA